MFFQEIFYFADGKSLCFFLRVRSVGVQHIVVQTKTDL